MPGYFPAVRRSPPTVRPAVATSPQAQNNVDGAPVENDASSDTSPKRRHEQQVSPPQQVERLMKSKGREFMWSERLGYLCTCLSNIGTGLRCSVHIQLRNLSKVNAADTCPDAAVRTHDASHAVPFVECVTGRCRVCCSTHCLMTSW